VTGVISDLRVMRLRRLTLIGGLLVVLLTVAVVTLLMVRARPMGASIGVHGYEKQANQFAACLLLTNTGAASLAVPLRFSCQVQTVGGATNYIMDTPYSVFLRPGDYVVLSNDRWRVRLPADAEAWKVSVQIRRMSGRERFVSAVGQSDVASPRLLSKLAGQPHEESDYQWIECESGLLEVPVLAEPAAAPEPPPTAPVEKARENPDRIPGSQAPGSDGGR